MKARAQTLKYSTRRQALFFTLIGCSAILMLGYAYLLNRTISHGIVVEREERSISLLNTRVSELERHYFEAKREITLSLAKSLGFQDVRDKIFVSRAGKAQALSVVNEN